MRVEVTEGTGGMGACMFETEDNNHDDESAQ